jgi:predicted Rossmann-fold nucleotide-binding protein
VGLLNARRYYDPLLAMVDHARNEGFIYAEHRTLFTAADHPEALLDALMNHTPPDGLERWLTRES